MADSRSRPAFTKRNRKKPPFAASSTPKQLASKPFYRNASPPNRKTTVRPPNHSHHGLPRMTLVDASRRLLLIAAFAFATTLLMTEQPAARAADSDGPLFAYVGTFSSPLHDVLPTQVDLPPGNGRGIHIFRVDRTSGALTPAGVYES